MQCFSDKCLNKARVTQVTKTEFDFAVRVRDIGCPKRLGAAVCAILLVVAAQHTPANGSMLNFQQFGGLAKRVESDADRFGLVVAGVHKGEE